jgi:hypothetical protein
MIRKSSFKRRELDAGGFDNQIEWPIIETFEKNV